MSHRALSEEREQSQDGRGEQACQQYCICACVHVFAHVYVCVCSIHLSVDVCVCVCVCVCGAPAESMRSMEKRCPSPLALDHLLISLLFVTRALIVHLQRSRRVQESGSREKNNRCAVGVGENQ